MSQASELSDAQVAALTFRDQLLGQTTTRGKTSIDRVWTVCQDLIDAGKRITVAEVGRTTEQRWGSPKAQGIRDQPDRLKRLVDLCATAQMDLDTASVSRKSYASSKVEALISEVADQTVRAKIRSIAEERDQLKQDLKNLRQAYQRLTPISELTPEQCYDETPSLPSTAPAADDNHPRTAADIFSEAEKQAVQKFLSDKFLYDEGFKIDPVLGLVTSQGRILLPIAFVEALRKVAEHEKRPAV